MKLINFILIISLFQACASMKSGQYVYAHKPSELNSLAKQHGLTLDELTSFNSDLKWNHGQGEWVFIPSKAGIAHLFLDSSPVYDYASLGTGQYVWPVPNFKKISSHYGPRGRRHHDGIDIPAPKGTPIVATDSGVVVYSDNKVSGYGNMIVIAHDKNVHSVYAHNNKNLVKKGQKVQRGQLIGHVGSTGRSTGPHLHFEIRTKNKTRNPANYLSSKN